MRPLSGWLLAALFLAAVAAACNEQGTSTLSGAGVLSMTPWTVPETAKYRLLKGRDVIGSGVLSIERSGDDIVLSQEFEFPDAKISDAATVNVDSASLQPLSATRLINGPEGDRTCDATYSANRVTVEQRSQKDERTDELDVPVSAYDTWADLFLWRTLAFAEDYEARYSDVLTCSLAKPEVLSVSLKVKGVEKVTVPAGTFDAWRLDIRSGGRTQKAWYEDDSARTLVRYDNGELVFELESRS